MSLTNGSLFSGIDGIALGLEWAGFGPVLWQVEKDEFCRRKLAWRYPDATQHEDVRNVGASNLPSVFLICGGFPCQDVSSAGKRAGLAGARSGLWYEFARIVGELRPRWVVVENVRSGAAKWVDTVRGDLEQLGYATLPVPVSASDCGAPHERARVFIVACRPSYHDDQKLAPADDGRRGSCKLEGIAPDTLCERCDQGSVYAQGWKNANPKRSFDETAGRNQAECTGVIADSHDDRCDVHELSRQALRHAPQHGGWTVEPALARVVHGLPGRVDYERALGNSVVPACSEVVGHVIRKLIEGPNQ